MMRKIIVIFGLIALLTFVFPVAASAPYFYEDDGGSAAMQVAHSSPAFNLAWPELMSNQISQIRETQNRVGNILGRFFWIFVEKGPLNPLQ
jgi:hypothetical protein